MPKKSDSSQLSREELVERRKRQIEGNSRGGKKSWDPSRVPQGVSKIRIAKMVYANMRRRDPERAYERLVRTFGENIAQELVSRWEGKKGVANT